MDQLTGVPETAQVAVVQSTAAPLIENPEGPDFADQATEPGDDATADGNVDESTTVDADASASLPDASAFGQQVAQDARDGGVNGREHLRPGARRC